MQQNSPLVSIIVPCYNQAQYLEEALQSVLQQTYDHWECIIVNDGSPDNTEEVALSWCAKDKRFIYVKKENGGLSSARNAGMNMMKGEYVQFLDCDDLIDRHKLAESVQLAGQGKAQVIVSDFEYLSEGKRIKGFNLMTDDLLTYEAMLTRHGFEFNIPIHTGLIQTRLLENFRFDEQIKFGEDWLMWLAIYKQRPVSAIIHKPYALYRLHGNNMTTDQASGRKKTLETRKHIYHHVLDEADRSLFFDGMIQGYANQYEKLLTSKTFRMGDRIRRLIFFFRKS